MASAHPYLGWAWPSGTHAWASLGYGQGDVTLLDGEAGRQRSDSTLRSAAAGGSVRVLSGGEGSGDFAPLTVDLKGEAWATWLEVEDNGDRIAGLQVKTNRVRVSAEGSRVFALGGSVSLTPSVELGMRLDGGDGETGAGVELGGEVDYPHGTREACYASTLLNGRQSCAGIVIPVWGTNVGYRFCASRKTLYTMDFVRWDRDRGRPARRGEIHL